MADSPEPSETRASNTIRALLLADPEARRAALDPAVVNVSHGEGIPIGCLGGGHSVFGRNGFQRLAFEAAPDMGPEYEAPRPAAPFAFYVFEGSRRFALQERPALARRVDETSFDPKPITRVFAYAELPRAHFRFEEPELELGLVLSAFSPLIEHNLEASTTPVQVFEFTLENRTSRERSLELWLSHVERLEVRGDIALRAEPAVSSPSSPTGVERRRQGFCSSFGSHPVSGARCAFSWRGITRAFARRRRSQRRSTAATMLRASPTQLPCSPSHAPKPRPGRTPSTRGISAFVCPRA